MFSLLVIASWKESQCVAGQQRMVRLSMCFPRALYLKKGLLIHDLEHLLSDPGPSSSATVQLGQPGLQLGDLVPVLGLLHLRLLNEQVRPHLSELLLQVLIQQRIILPISSFNQDCLFPAPKRNIEI
jgi:hypothetical protein